MVQKMEYSNTSNTSSGTLLNVSTDIGNSSTIVVPSPTGSMHLLIQWMDFYYIPTVIAFGLCGNAVSLVVFLTTYLNRLSLSVYLGALAISDSAFLLALWLAWCKYDDALVFHRPGLCQLVIFSTYVFSFLSAWLVVSFTVERYIAICHPFKRHEMCTVSRAKKVVAGLTGTSIAMYACSVWITGVQTTPDGQLYCMPLPGYYLTHMVLTYADIIVSLILPFLSVFFFNLKIAHNLASLSRQSDGCRRHESMTSLNRTSHNSTSRPSMNSHAQVKVTKLLVIVSSMFLILNLPSCVMRFRLFVITFTDPLHKRSRLERDIQRLCQFLFYLNFSINFFLYSVCGSKFREALCRLLRKLRYKMAGLFHCTIRGAPPPASAQSLPLSHECNHAKGAAGLTNRPESRSDEN